MATVPAPEQTRMTLTPSEIGLAFIIPLATITITISMIAFVVLTSKPMVPPKGKQDLVVQQEKQRIAQWEDDTQKRFEAETRKMEIRKVEARRLELRKIEIQKLDAQKAEGQRLALRREQSEKRRKKTAVELDSNPIHEMDARDITQLSPKSLRKVLPDTPPIQGMCHAI